MSSPPGDCGPLRPPPPSTAVLRGGGGDGRGLGDSSIGAARDCLDVSSNKKSKGHAKHIPSGSSILGKLDAGLQSDTLGMEDGCSSSKISGLSKEQKTACVNDDDSKYPKLGFHFFACEENRNNNSAVGGTYAEAVPEKRSEIMNARNAKPLSVTREEAAVMNPVRAIFCEEGNVVQPSKKEIRRMEFQSSEQMNQRASRLADSLLRHRSLSPTDTKNENKRPVVICQYFSRGWCINGKNCRFVHSVDSVDNISQRLGEGEAAAIRKYESQADQGLSEIPERTKLFHFPGRVHQWEHGESPMWHQYNRKHSFSPFQRGDLSSGFPADSQRFLMYKDGPRNYVSPNVVGSYPIPGSHLLPEYGSFAVGSSSSTTSSKTYQTSRTVSSLATSLEGLDGKQDEFVVHDYTSRVMSNKPNPTLDTTPQRKSLLPSNKSSVSGEYSFSQNAGHRAQKFVIDDAKAKFSSGDWEPSIPFRPSYFSAFPDMTSAGSMHESLCFNHEEHHIGDRPYKVSFPTPGASMVDSSHDQVYSHLVLTTSLGPDYNGDRESLHIHNNFHQSAFDKGVYEHHRGFSTNETEHVGRSVAELQDSLPKDGKPDGHIQLEEFSDQNPGNYSDRASHKEELKMEWCKPSDATYDDHNIDEDVYKESKTLKHFRFKLIDFIKDLVRPTWHRGQLSKDAHNLIVKKSVDKVLSTLEPNQIPSTEEFMRHYLSMSQPKIAKLVQGYVERHR